MSDNTILTVDQENAVKALIAAQTNTLLEQVRAKTIEAITTNQNMIVDTIQQGIIEAVNANQKVIIATAQHGSTTEKETKRSQLLTSLVPVVLTALFSVGLSVFGYFTWKTQANVQQRIDQSNVRLATRLSFTDEFYKRRFAAYEKIYGQVLLLRRGADARDTKTVTQAMDVLANLDDYYGADKLYLSDKITDQMDRIWVAGIDAFRYRQGSAAFSAQLKDLERHMKEDLWTAPFD